MFRDDSRARLYLTVQLNNDDPLDIQDLTVGPSESGLSFPQSTQGRGLQTV